MKKKTLTRRATLKGIGGVGAFSLLDSFGAFGAQGNGPFVGPAAASSDVRRQIIRLVGQTPFVDTHEHLFDEKDCLAGLPFFESKPNDWTLILHHYFSWDLVAAGMPKDAHDRFFSRAVDPLDKWNILEPYWPAVKNTGYGRAIRWTLQRLYEVDSLSARSVRQVQEGFVKTRRPGFYGGILKEQALIESCQVNAIERPFRESAMPALLMQDINITRMFADPDWKVFAEPTGIQVSSLDDWHRVIDWWFARYGRYAVAVKSQNAYDRDIDYEPVSAEKAEPAFRKKRSGGVLTAAESKLLEDHLFWYAVDQAVRRGLPVKLHTGYLTGANQMPLSMVRRNPASACDLCRRAPGANFVLMHIGYPYYEEIIALAKQYSNAYVDMCWAWILNPLAAKDFLKKYLLTAPADKIFTFGGDYYVVEPVLGHSVMARQGISLALSELVEEGWLSLDDALELVEPIMRGNARRVFHLDEKEKILSGVKW